MRIVIEINGTRVLATDVSPSTTGPSSVSAEPPAELLEVARALGAHSAGPAAFVAPAGAAVSVSPALATPHFEATAEETADVDAGAAPAADVPTSVARRRAPTSRARTRGAKKVSGR